MPSVIRCHAQTGKTKKGVSDPTTTDSVLVIVIRTVGRTSLIYGLLSGMKLYTNNVHTHNKCSAPVTVKCSCS